MTWSTRVAVVAGGAVGSLVRWALQGLPDAGSIPTGTLVANLGGALALGLAVGWLGLRRNAPTWLPLTGGALGATTTFSAFAVEVTDRLGPEPAAAATYLSLSIGAGLLLVEVGRRTGRRLAGASDGALT